MESNSCETGLHLFGNMSAECTLLITDIFNLFPSSFCKLIPLFESSYRIVSHSDDGFDVFNYEKHSCYQTIQDYANDLISFLQREGIRNVTYLAHSVNAFVAFYAAVKEPQLFNKIALLSATPYLKEDLAALYATGVDVNVNDEAVFKNMIQFEEIRDEQPEQLPALLSRSFSKMNPDKAKQIFNMMMMADCRPYLNRITVPVMILQGTGDKVVTNEAAYFMHRRIPDSYVVKIRAKGHLPQLTAPEEVFRAIQIFMYPAVC